MEELRRYIRAIKEVESEHELRELYQKVLRGEAGWEEYGRRAWELKDRDPDAALVANYHILKTLKTKHESAKERDFWKHAERITSIIAKNEMDQLLLKETHFRAIEFAEKHPKVIDYPEFWRTLMGTAYVEHMSARELLKTTEFAKKGINYLNVKDKKMLAYPRDLLGVIKEFVESRLKNGRTGTIERTWLAQISADADIHIRTADKLRRKK